jgi:catechol 2,3-dioxygenase-like lactoylglutathione lyase family enzyme
MRSTGKAAPIQTDQANRTGLPLNLFTVGIKDIDMNALRSCAVATFLALVPVGFATAAEDADGEIDLVSVMSRMTIVVKDADASKRFYTYALGYDVLGDRVIDREIVKTQMNLNMDQTIRFVILTSSHEILGKRREGAGIGLIQVGNPAPPVMTRPGDAILASGEAMMAIRTTDIETVYARLKELGARIVLEPMKSPDGLQTELVVHDPDGVRIHVVERPDMAFD